MKEQEQDRLPDLRKTWPERLDRVRRSQARVNPKGMTRPARDPTEREFLEATDQLGPFIKVPTGEHQDGGSG